MLRFTPNLTMLFTEHAFLDRFAAARDAGFTHVELQFPYAHPPEAVAGAARRAGVEVVLFNLPAGDWRGGERGIAALAGREGEFRAGVDQALRYAEALGTQKLNALAGVVPAAKRREALDVLDANLRVAVEALQTRGVSLVVEAINGYDVPGFLLQVAGDLEAVLQRLEPLEARMQLDVYHLQRSQGELVGTITRHLPRIGHVQIADVPGRHEPGTGEIRYDFVLDALEGLGYEGFVGLEYLPATGTLASLGFLARRLRRGDSQPDRPRS